MKLLTLFCLTKKETSVGINNMQTKLPNLGIIAGNGDLPEEIARLYKNSGGKCVIASLNEGEEYTGFDYIL